MATLKFKSHLVPLVLSGEKDVTWRLFDDKDLKVADELLLVDADTGEEFATAAITATREKKLGDIEESDYDEHGRFESKDTMYETFRSYYGDDVGPDTIVKIVKFKL